MCQEIISLKKQRNKDKEKLLILQSIGIIVIKSGWSPTPVDIISKIPSSHGIN